MKMLVLGAGLQGSACAYDLLQNPEVEEVRLADIRVGDLPHFLAPYSGHRLIPTPLDVRDSDAVFGLMRDSDAVMSALPYYLNYDMAVCAVDAGLVVHVAGNRGRRRFQPGFRKLGMTAGAAVRFGRLRSGLAWPQDHESRAQYRSGNAGRESMHIRTRSSR